MHYKLLLGELYSNLDSAQNVFLCLDFDTIHMRFKLKEDFFMAGILL